VIKPLLFLGLPVALGAIVGWIRVDRLVKLAALAVLPFLYGFGALALDSASARAEIDAHNRAVRERLATAEILSEQEIPDERDRGGVTEFTVRVAPDAPVERLVTYERYEPDGAHRDRVFIGAAAGETSPQKEDPSS
jgi:hypothetical protein